MRREFSQQRGERLPKDAGTAAMAISSKVAPGIRLHNLGFWADFLTPGHQPCSLSPA